MIKPLKKPLPAIFYIPIIIFTLFILMFDTEQSSAFDQTYTLYGNVLSRFVKNGLVDYKGLRTDPGTLRSFLESTGRVSRQEFDAWPMEEQLAFLINLYNASTIYLIIDNYPVKSIRDIKSGGKGPWDLQVVKIFGGTITLNELENGIVRESYKEPRAHFTLVCAAMGCPPLLAEPYTGAKLDIQLDAQTIKFLSDARKNSFDEKSKTLHISPIFKWYAADFAADSGSVIGFLKKYYGGLISGEYIIAYTYYDWSLNDMSDKMK